MEEGKCGRIDLMPKKAKTDYEKLSDQIRFIACGNESNVIELLDTNSLGLSEIDNEYGGHTLLKLSYLNYYMGIFSRIAKSRKDKGGFSKILFVDAFGGSGLVKIRNTNYSVLGSSLLAAMNEHFDKIISFEKDEERAEILSKRMELLCPGKFEVVKGDVNINIEKIVKEQVTARTIVLFFIDPEGMEPEFAKLKTLMKKTQYVDILMNYTWGVYRLQGRIEKRFTDNDIKRMQSFLPGYEVGDTPDESLLSMFEEEFGKPFGDMVPINSIGNKTEYSMILRIRETSGGTSFIEPMKSFGKIIGNYDGKNCEAILRTIKGDQAIL
ncbi:MAG: three-Cys-motif partner protein TcmP [Thermoplasmataceae archaeon]|jgi:three-Cys-motif partner protein